MEKKLEKWGFNNGDMQGKSSLSIRSVTETIMGNVSEDEKRVIIHLGRGDPSAIPCFRTSPVAEEALFAAIKSAKFNGYAPAIGLLSARRSIAEYLSRDLPHQLSPDDVFLTPGANQAIEVVTAILARPGANILLPNPGYPFYDVRAALSNVEVRHFDLLPGKGWEVDLRSVEALTDNNTIAMVIINPGNPCGNVFTSEHLKEIAETAKKLGILVIADEVYSHLSFGSKPFVPMGVYGSVTPVLTLGSISKRWIIPGWRLGWIAMVDSSGILKKSGVCIIFLPLLPCLAFFCLSSINLFQLSKPDKEMDQEKGPSLMACFIEELLGAKCIGCAVCRLRNISYRNMHTNPQMICNISYIDLPQK